MAYSTEAIYNSNVAFNHLESDMAEYKGVYCVGDSIGIRFMYKGQRYRPRLKPNGVTLTNSEPNKKWASNFRKDLLGAIRAEKMYGKPFDLKKHFEDQNCNLSIEHESEEEGDRFGVFLWDWFRRKESKYSHTQVRVVKISIRIFDNLLGKLMMSELKVKHFRDWVDTKQNAGTKVKTIRNYLGPISLALDEAVEDGKIEFNPIGKVNLSKTEDEKEDEDTHEEIDPLDLQDIKSVIASATGALLNFIRVCFGTGLRTGEMFALAYEDIDFTAGTAQIWVARSHGKFKRLKRREGRRIIALDKDVLKAIDDQKQYTYLKSAVDCGKWGMRHIIFYNPQNDSLYNRDDQFRVQWAKILEKAKVRYRYPYQMRHTFACMCLIFGKTEKWIADYFGHTTTQMVQRHYARVIKKLEEAKKAAGISNAPGLDMTNGNTQVNLREAGG